MDNNIQDFKKLLNNKRNQKIFIITGKKSFNLSGANKIIAPILKNFNFKFFFKTKYFPSFTELKKIISELKIYKPTLIVAIGGGCVLDYAKIANFLVFSKNLKNEIKKGSYSSKNKFCELVAIPTTAGSGAEVTANSVIYINNQKYSVEDKQIKPDYFYLIPELILKNSIKIKNSAGFDAVSQAVESLFSLRSNSASLTYAKKSLELSLKNFIPYVSSPNKNNSIKMLVASNLAGKAISISKTTAPHALSYPFSSHFNISHGHAVSLTFNSCLKFNFENLNKSNSDFNLLKRFEILFKSTKTKNIKELDTFFLKLKKKSGLETNFKNLKININKEADKILSEVNQQRLKNNPIKMTNNDLKSILINQSE
jgi:alcohol dehydrogenase class IV